MSLKDVINRFALVSGLEQEEISKWVFVIVDCIKYFESRIGNVNVDGLMLSRLTHACAVYAYYKYSLFSFANASTKFKAGDVEITSAESITEKAHIMWQQEKEEVADIIDFDDFLFLKVDS